MKVDKIQDVCLNIAISTLLMLIFFLIFRLASKDKKITYCSLKDRPDHETVYLDLDKILNMRKFAEKTTLLSDKQFDLSNYWYRKIISWSRAVYNKLIAFKNWIISWIVYFIYLLPGFVKKFICGAVSGIGFVISMVSRLICYIGCKFNFIFRLVYKVLFRPLLNLLAKIWCKIKNGPVLGIWQKNYNVMSSRVMLTE